jgi:DNA polymerase
VALSRLVLALDWETYYDDRITLKKMPVAEYARVTNPFGAAMSLDGRPSQWCSLEQIEKVIMTLPASTLILLSHNARFDLSILQAWVPAFTERFDEYVFADTMLMARVALSGHLISFSLDSLARYFDLPEKDTQALLNVMGLGAAGLASIPEPQRSRLTTYACADNNKAVKLFEFLRPNVPDEEMRVIDWTLRAYLKPTIGVDREALARYKKFMADRQSTALARVGAGIEDLRSADKFANVLSNAGITPQTKQSPSDPFSKTWAFAKTDDFMIWLSEHEDPMVQALAAARLSSKSTLAATRVATLWNRAETNEGGLPVPLRYFGAHTGRFSGDEDVNLQNIPTRIPDDEPSLREAFVAFLGDVMIVGDEAQVEARILAYVAAQHDLVRAFREGRDVYAEFAKRVFNRRIDPKVDKAERFFGKTSILGLGYGMGADKFYTVCTRVPILRTFITETFAAGAVSTYRTTFRNVSMLWQLAEHVVRWLASIEDPVIHDHRYQMDARALHGAGAVTAVGDHMVMTLPCGLMLPCGMRMDPHGVRVCYVGLPGGTELRYRNLRMKARERTEGNPYPTDVIYDKVRGGRVVGTAKLFGAKLVENIIQALARIVLHRAMLTLIDEGIVWPALLVHDEIVGFAKDAALGRAAMHRALVQPVDFLPGCPLAAEVGTGDNWRLAKP